MQLFSLKKEGEGKLSRGWRKRKEAWQRPSQLSYFTSIQGMEMIKDIFNSVFQTQVNTRQLESKISESNK